MAPFAAAERFLADRAAPYCSLSVAKSFGQLRCAPSYAPARGVRAHAPLVPTKRSTRTTSARRPGPAHASSLAK